MERIDLEPDRLQPPPPSRAVREGFEAVLGTPARERHPPSTRDHQPIDVRDYLLDPPPTAAELDRIERRRLLVRRGSVAAAALLAILLVAPWPGDRAAGPDADAAPDREAVPAPVDTAEPRSPDTAGDGPVRLDRPPAARTQRRAAPAARPRAIAPAARRSVHRAAASARAAAPAPAPAPHRPRPPATPAPVPTAPARPDPRPQSLAAAPAPQADAAILVPVL